MWAGYSTFDGVEVINASRTEAYAKNAGIGWLRPLFKNTDLRTVLGASAYVDPLSDDAPWVDPRRPESKEFYGVYPLDVTGVEDSTSTAVITESIGEGGNAGLGRRGTKGIVFNTVLIAASEGGAEYGLQWLKRVLTADGCAASRSCDGHDMTYLAHAPHLGPNLDPRICGDRLSTDSSSAAVIAQRLVRTLRRVTLTTPPVVVSKRSTSDRGAAWSVQWTLTATNPVEFVTGVPILENWLDPVLGPFPTGGAPTDGTHTVSVVSTASSYAEVACLPPSYTPLYDPLAPAVVAPPPPPGIDWITFAPPTAWDRRRVVLPAFLIPAWTDVAPVISLSAPTTDLRNIRIRFYADPTGTGNMPTGADCDFDGDLLVGWIPTAGTLTIDGVDRVVYVDSVGDVRRRADSLIYTSNGDPFEWPELTCGVPYVMTLDVAAGDPVPVVDLSLVERYL